MLAVVVGSMEQSQDGGKNLQPDAFRIGDWRVRAATGRIEAAGRAHKLEPRVMEVLVYLAGRPGEVVSRDELERDVWRGALVGYDAVTGTIIKLRKALDDDARHPRYIETIPKKGYRLIAEVARDPAEPHDGDRPAARSGQQRSVGIGVVLTGIVAVAVLVAAWFLPVRKESVETQPDESVQEVTAGKPAIAVLPFAYLTNDPDKSYFSDGITADLITALSKISGLQVISRDSTFSYREAEVSDAQIGTELGVDYLLRGNIQKDRDRIRLNVHLVATRSGQTVWAERYDRLFSDIFSIQDDLAERIVRTLEVKLAPEERKRIIRNYLVGLDAYDAFLRGVDYYSKRSFADNQLAVESFRKAIELDPGFARAYAGLALAYSWASGDASRGSAEQAHRLASETVEKAIAIDASIPQVYFVKGRVELYKQNYELAIRQIQKAIEIEPNYADAYALLASTLHFSGRPAEGLQAMTHAVLLNPRIPAAYLMIRGSLHYAEKDYEMAVKDLSRSLQINPNYLQSKAWLAATYAAQGRVDDAQWEMDEIRVLSPDIDFAWIERAYPIQDFHYRQRFRADLEKAGL